MTELSNLVIIAILNNVETKDVSDAYVLSEYCLWPSVRYTRLAL